jgi:hypothetical protein
MARQQRVRVLNPLTGRWIYRGGRRYHDVLASGRALDVGADVMVLQLPEQLRTTVARGLVFAHPSDGPGAPIDRHRSPTLFVLQSDELGPEINRLLANPDDPVNGAVATWAEVMEPLLRNEDDFVRGVMELEIGGLILVRNPDDMDGPLLEWRAAGGLLPAAEPDPRVLRHDMPLSLPYADVFRNEGTNDACVHRFLHDPVNGFRYREEHCRNMDYIDMLALAATQGDHLTVYDVSGNLLDDNRVPRDLRRRHMSCIVYDGHVYPMAYNEKPRLHKIRDDGTDVLRHYDIDAPEFLQEFSAFTDLADLAATVHALDFRHNDRLVIRGNPMVPDGVYYRSTGETVLSDEAHRKAMMLLPPSDGSDANTMFLMKAGVQDLNHHDAGWHKEDNPDLSDAMTVDGNKAYWCATRDLVKNLLGFPMRIPDVFSRFEPTTEQDVGCGWGDWYAIRPDTVSDGKTLERCGYHTDGPYLGIEVHTLREMGVGLTVTHSMRWNTRMKSSKEIELSELLDSYDDKQRKQWGPVVGLFGRIVEHDIMEIRCMRHDGVTVADDEQARIEQHGFQRGIGALSVRHKVTPRQMNRCYVYCYVKAVARYNVLRLIRRCKPYALPRIVRTDALLYECQPFRSIAARLATGKTAPREVMEVLMQCVPGQECFTTSSWKFEDDNKPGVRQFIWNQLPWDGSPVWERSHNITWTGDPGVGKTTAVQHAHERGQRPIDVMVCFSQRGATRLKEKMPDVEAMNAHKFFDVRPYNELINPKRLEQFRGKHIFIDEAQAIGTKFWAMIAVATYEFNIRFTFTMDLKQLCNVDKRPNNRLGASPINFNSPLLGTVREKEADEYSRTSDPLLISAREQVQAGTFISGATSRPPCPLTDWTEINLCATNKEKEWVNDYYASLHGISPGDPGLYMCNINKSLQTRGRCVNGTKYDYDGIGIMTPHDGEGEQFLISPQRLNDDMTRPGKRKRDWSFGYAQTVHKSIGETYRPEDHPRVTLWEFDDNLNVPSFKRLKYTSLTRVCTFDQLRFVCRQPVRWARTTEQ